MHIYERCAYLANEIGYRWIGSDGEKNAGDWIEGLFREMGLNVERPEIDCPAWDYQNTELIVAGKLFASDAQMFSPGCDVAGELIQVMPQADTTIPVDVTGKIAMIKESDTLNTSVYKNGVLFRNALLDSLKAAGVLAVIIISTLEETYATKMFRNPDSTLPCTAVNRKDGELLLAKTGEIAELKIVARQRQGKTSYISAEIGPADAPICIIATHFDAAPISKAAVDNASGVAVMLALAEYFAENPPESVRFRFMSFGGHEYGGLDMCGFTSKYYAKHHSDELLKIKYLLHLDVVGIKNSDPVIEVKGDSNLLDETIKLFASDPRITPEEYNGFVGADFGAFMREGVPCIMLGSSPTEKNEYVTTAYHSPLDDMRWIGTDGELDRTFDAALTMLIR
ncbi:MAG: M28 family peptidase [Victivallaceae bacterium]|nr:M28 family peptidase [Victivallaceae bacterium]